MIRAYLVDSVTIVKYAGFDSWNEPLATSDISVKAKWEYKTRLVRDIRGEEVISSAMVYLSKDEVDNELGRALDHEDRLTFDSVEHSIIRIDTPKSFSGPHYEVYVA